MLGKWSFCSPLTTINPLSLTRYMLNHVKSMKIYSGRGGLWVLETLSHHGRMYMVRERENGVTKEG